MSRKFINLAKYKVVYKIVRKLTEEIYYSAFAASSSKLYYKVNKFTYPIEELAEIGYKIFAFRTLEGVLWYSKYGTNLAHYIFTCHTTHYCEPMVKDINNRLDVNRIKCMRLRDKYDLTAGIDWPCLTVFCEDLSLVEEIGKDGKLY